MQTARGGYGCERVSIFSLFGSINNNDNSISEEITQKIKKGNRAYYACKVLMTSKLTNKYNKWKIYMTLKGQ